jgi:hypothetical protein
MSADQVFGRRVQLSRRTFRSSPLRRRRRLSVELAFDPRYSPEEEIKELMDAKKGSYLEATSNGFDVKILREVIRMRKQDPAERFTA